MNRMGAILLFGLGLVLSVYAGIHCWLKDEYGRPWLGIAFVMGWTFVGALALAFQARGRKRRVVLASALLTLLVFVQPEFSFVTHPTFGDLAQAQMEVDPNHETSVDWAPSPWYWDVRVSLYPCWYRFSWQAPILWALVIAFIVRQLRAKTVGPSEDG